MPNYQLKITNFNNTPIGAVKKWCLTFLFDKEKYVLHYEISYKVRTEAKKSTLCLRIQTIAMDKTICRFYHTNRIEAEKMEAKMKKCRTNS